MGGAQQTTGQRLADNVTLTLTARAAMLATPVVIMLAGWALSDLIKGQRDAVHDVANHVEIVTSSLIALDKRVTAIESARQVAIKNAEDSRVAVMGRLDDLFRGQSEVNARLAGLSAKVDALKDRLDARVGLNMMAPR